MSIEGRGYREQLASEPEPAPENVVEQKPMRDRRDRVRDVVGYGNKVEIQLFKENDGPVKYSGTVMRVNTGGKFWVQLDKGQRLYSNGATVVEFSSSGVALREGLQVKLPKE